MTGAVLVPEPDTAPPAGRIRRRIVWSAVAVVVVAALLTGGLLWRVSLEYDGVGRGGWFGPEAYTPAHLHTPPHGAEFGPGVLGPVGTTQAFEFPLDNDGAHPVTITSVSADGPDVTVRGWAVYRPDPGHLLNGLPSRTRSFPAHITPGGFILVRLLVTQPHCRVGSERYFDATVVVHWHAMITNHTTRTDPMVQDPSTYLRLCPASP